MRAGADSMAAALSAARFGEARPPFDGKVADGPLVSTNDPGRGQSTVIAERRRSRRKAVHRLIHAKPRRREDGEWVSPFIARLSG
jgi:hypothetical protein